MTALPRNPPLASVLARAMRCLGLLSGLAIVAIGPGLAATLAHAAPPEAATKPRRQTATPARVGPPTKPSSAKAKPRARAARKSGKPAAAKAAAAPPAPRTTAKPAPAPKATQVMDFDTDQVEGQRLEPGFELIEGAPRRARQPSLVPPPSKPEGSVVRGN